MNTLKSTYSVILAALCGWLLVSLPGCGGRAYSPRLVELDSLIARAPDSATALLAAMPDDSLRGEADRAYHALLLTQAKYKAYVPFGEGAVDTINLAVNHFHNSHDIDKRTRSHLYKGCVMEDMGKPDSAMYYYKAAEDDASQSGDHYNQGYALMRQAWLYQCVYAHDRAIKLYRRSLISFGEQDYKSIRLQVYNELSSLYATVNIDSALICGDITKSLCLELDSLKFDNCMRALSDCHYMNKDYAKSIDSAKEAMRHTQNDQLIFEMQLLIARAFAMRGMTDSSAHYMNQARSPQNKRDSVIFWDTKSVLAGKSGNKIESLELNLLADNIADTIFFTNTTLELDEAAKAYEKSSLKDELSSENQRLGITLSAFVIIAIILATIVFLNHREKVKHITEKNILAGQLDSIEKELVTHMTENEELVNVNAKMSQTVEEKHILLQAAKDEIKHLKSILDLPSLDKIGISHRNYQNESVNELINEIRQQAITRTNQAKSAAKSPRELKVIMQSYFDKDYLATMKLLVLTLFPKLRESICSEQTTPNSTDEAIIIMHFLRFPNSVIAAYMGYSSQHSVTNKKTEIAVKILGNGAKINNLLD